MIKIRDYCNRSFKSLMLALVTICALYNVQSQELDGQQLDNLSFDEINKRVQQKVNSFERTISLPVINNLLLADFSDKQLTTLKVHKLRALVESELFDEALELSHELLLPIKIAPELEVQILLERALMYEVLAKMPESKKDLNRIQRMYEDKLVPKDELYGRYLYRMSSWYRVNDREQESIVWAQDAIAYGLENNYPNVLATGYLIMGLNTTLSEGDIRKSYFIKGLEINKGANIAQGVVNMHNLLSDAYYREKQYNTALKYNDTALAIINDHRTNYFRAPIYKHRSLIEERLNHKDSALYYQKLYADEAIAAFQRSRDIKFRELDYQLDNEKEVLKNIKLETQLNEASNKETNFTIGLIMAAVFLLCLGLLIITLASRNKRINDQNTQIKITNQNLSTTIEEKEFLLKEVNHRVKNNLAFVQSLVAFQIDEATAQETKSKLESLNGRINAIAVLHDQFVEAKNSISKKEISFAPYVQTIAQAQILSSKRKISFEKNINKIKVNLETAVPLGILINELITNTIKHADPMGNQLCIEMSLFDDGERLQLEYRDNGKSFEVDKDNESLGSYIIKTMVLQLKGSMTRDDSNYSILIERR